MLKKYKICKIFMFLIIVVTLGKIENCYADNEEKSDSNKAYEDIQESLEYVRQNIKYIDGRVTDMKKTNAYETYPAVRLNVETPLFGINSLIKNKLLIKENIATTDIISGYSVYDITRTNKVKVPSLSVGSVVVSTREIELNENMSMADANQTLKTVLAAMKQSKSSKEFIDEYINKNFNEYTGESFKKTISDINSNADELEKKLQEQENKLIYLDVMNSEKYEEFLKEYNNIYSSIYSIKKQIKNILISEESIKKCEASLKDIESKINDLETNINEEEKNLDNNLDYAISKFLYRSQSKLNDVNAYLGNSYDIVSIEDLKDTANKISVEENKKDSKSKLLINYSIVSDDIVDSMQYILNEETENLLNYKSNNEEYAYGTTEYKDIINKFIESYKSLTKEQSKFFKNNYEMLANDSKTKLSSIVDYADAEYIANDYFYFNVYFENDLDELNQKYSSESYINDINKLNFYKQNINGVIERYQNVNSIYTSLTKAGKIS